MTIIIISMKKHVNTKCRISPLLNLQNPYVFSATYGSVHPDSANKLTPIMYNYGVQVQSTTVIKLTNLTAVAGSFYPSICNHTAH